MSQVAVPPSDQELRLALKHAIQAAEEAAIILRKFFYQVPLCESTHARSSKDQRSESKDSISKSSIQHAMVMDTHSEADLLAERKIREILAPFNPQWGFRAEEEPHLNRMSHSTHHETWLVDPNDGTSAFMKGQRGASISIALIRSGIPVLGVVYAYAAPDPQGDLFTWAENTSPLQRNGIQIQPQWNSSWQNQIILVSNQADRISQAYHKILYHKTLDQRAHYRVAPGIAYRLALCASGEAEAAISIAGPRDFDYAGGHALLRGAGGDLWDEQGQKVRYKGTAMQRLGFAFGGQSTSVKYLKNLSWSLVFEAWRDRQTHTGFVMSHQSYLIQDSSLLTRLQGAWWGWHLGFSLYYAMQKNSVDHEQIRYLIKNELSSESMVQLNPAWMRHHGSDTDFIIQVRTYLESKDDLWTYMQNLWPVSIWYACTQNQDYQEDCQTHLQELTVKIEDEWDQLPLLCALYGALYTRKVWPTRCISELLSYRQGPTHTWQPDGDHLIEKIGSVLVDLITNQMN